MYIVHVHCTCTLLSQIRAYLHSYNSPICIFTVLITAYLCTICMYKPYEVHVILNNTSMMKN